MIKKFFGLALILASILLFSNKASAQMMGWGFGQNQNPPTQAEIQDEQNMQNAGLQIWQKLQSGALTCQQLTGDDYEKLGEYFMGEAAGSAENHVYWDNGIQSMMGDQGDTNMHIAWGERGSGCLSNAQIPSNTPSFFQGMMGYFNPNQYQNQNQSSNQNSNGNNPNTNQGGDYNMMWGYGAGNAAGWGAGFGVFGILTWVVVLIDLILLGVFLWKKIQK